MKTGVVFTLCLTTKLDNKFNNKIMKILITGGAGYKGTILVKKLLELGHNVTILDNFMYGFEPILHLISNPLLSVIKNDIRNLNETILKDFDVIYHLAGISGYPACEANPHSAQLINVEATKLLKELASAQQIIIYASTTSFYGQSGNKCDETTPVQPVSLYGVTKYQAEQILMERENTISLRFATIFGVSPRMRSDLLVNDFTYRSITDRCIVLCESGSTRTFLHIEDAIDAYALSLKKFQIMKGEIFNVGHESLNFTKLEIAEKIASQTGCKIIRSEMNDPDVRSFEVSFEKIRKLGFIPKRTLDEGVAEMVKLYNFYKPYLAYKTI